MSNINDYSNPAVVFKRALAYGIPAGNIRISTRKDKKYDVLNPNTGKYVSFGALGYEDFTKHKDPDRRRRYLARATNIKGTWRDDPYSPNSLSINLLW